MHGIARRSVGDWIGSLSYRTKLVAGASIAALGVVAAGGAAYALWSAQDTVSGGTVTAGDLTLVYGAGSWLQATPGVAAPAGGSLTAAPERPFASMPGDLVEVRLPVTTTLTGDNLTATMNVEMSEGAAEDLNNGVVSATYRVEDAEFTPVTEEAEIGTPVAVAGLAGSNAGVTANWTVVVSVSVLGDYRWSDLAPITNISSWALDGIDVTLQQVRGGVDTEPARAAA